MGLFDKLKTILYDVEEVEVEKKIPIEEKKNAPASPLIVGREAPKGVGIQPDIRKVSPAPPKPVVKPMPEKAKDDIEDVVSERELFKSESTFKFPVVFNEKDFVSEDTPYKKNNVVETANTKIRQQRLNNNNQPVLPKTFKPSPIISPIYGILDKNYKKEDLMLVDESAYVVPRQKKVDFDMVRKKAYGTLTEDLEDTLMLSLKEEIEAKEEKEPQEKDLIEIDGDDQDLVVVNELEELLDETPKKEVVTIGEAHENYADYGKEYKPNELQEIEKEVELKPIKPIEIANDTEEIEEVDKHKNLELTEDLFNLINSMYDEE